MAFQANLTKSRRRCGSEQKISRGLRLATTMLRLSAACENRRQAEKNSSSLSASIKRSYQ
jgi:hypothetical protein